MTFLTRKLKFVGETASPTWHLTDEQDRYSKEIEVKLRNNLLGPSIGWSIQLGGANPVRDASLYEVLALCAGPNHDCTWDFIQRHLDLIRNIEEYIVTNGFHASQTISRDRVDALANRLRDLIRLRREAFYSRGFMVAGDPRIKQMNDALSRVTDQKD